MIPFNRPPFIGPELDYVKDAFARHYVSGDGDYGRRVEKLLEELMGARRVLLTTSCTHALEMSAMLLGVGPGDEVIVPSFTFVSTANAFVLRGAKPIFAHIRPDTLDIDDASLPSLLTERTKAIVPVHYAGVACEMDAILELASAKGIAVVEDNAHGLFGTLGNKQLGTFGALATQSFHETKNFSCGEGGALIVNDESLLERAEILREKGTNRSRFFRGLVDKYTWVDIGSSYVLSDVLAAVLLAQLEAREQIQTARRRIWERYAAELADWGAKRGVRMPLVPPGREHTSHMFQLLLPDLAARTAFIAHLAERGAKAVFHYVPLHLSPMGMSFGGRPGQCPVTERISDQLVRLPLFTQMTSDEQTKVIEAVRAF
jgi:dTDP-4-amino-4,6-dideoxygalactose transaminase